MGQELAELFPIIFWRFRAWILQLHSKNYSITAGRIFNDIFNFFTWY